MNPVKSLRCMGSMTNVLGNMAQLLFGGIARKFSTTSAYRQSSMER